VAAHRPSPPFSLVGDASIPYKNIYHEGEGS
jgi:hypothetical protein